MECRLCLDKLPTKLIFEFQSAFTHTIRKLLKINQDDGLPQSICYKCCNKIEDINTFIMKCDAVNNILRNKYDLSIKKLSNPYDLTIKYEENTDDVSLDNVNKIQQGNIQIKSEVISHEDFYDETETDTNIKHDVNMLKKDVSELNCVKKKMKTSNSDYNCQNGIMKIIHNEQNELIKYRTECINKEICKKGIKLKEYKEEEYSRNKNLKLNDKDTCDGGLDSTVNSKHHICAVCKVELPSKKQLFLHKRTHSKRVLFQCDLCPQNYTTLFKLSKHLSKCHRDNPITVVKCDMCRKEFNNKKVLSSHIKLDHSTVHFSCTVCEKTFKNRVRLRIHEDFKHFNKKPEFSCSYCGKLFNEHSSVKDHEQIHIGIRNKICTFCSKAFYTTSSLSRHLAVHTNHRPHVCSYCSKAFSKPYKLRKHVLSHTGETPFECPICLKGFTSKSNMKSHFNYNHKEFHIDEALTKFPKKRQDELET